MKPSSSLFLYAIYQLIAWHAKWLPKAKIWGVNLDSPVSFNTSLQLNTKSCISSSQET